MTASLRPDTAGSLSAILAGSRGIPAKLNLVHEFTDKMLSDQTAQLGEIVCKAGCSYCCHFHIAVSRQEADLLASVSGRQLTVPTTPASKFKGPKPCPFLKDNQCSVYEFRPTSCRAYNVLKAANGHPDCTQLSSPEEFGMAVLRSTAAPPVLQEALADLARQAKQAPRLRDVRDWFPD